MNQSAAVTRVRGQRPEAAELERARRARGRHWVEGRELTPPRRSPWARGSPAGRYGTAPSSRCPAAASLHRGGVAAHPLDVGGGDGGVVSLRASLGVLARQLVAARLVYRSEAVIANRFLLSSFLVAS